MPVEYPKVLHVLSSLDNRQGGPPRSVMSLACAQAQLGASVRVISGGRKDLTVTRNDAGVQIAQGRHMPLPFGIAAPQLIRHMRQLIVEADIVHIHGTWTGTTTIAERICRHYSIPFVISPRGMLDRDNIQRRRPRLKAIYFRCLERANLEAAAGWHFLDKSEQEGCSWLGIPEQYARSMIAPNGLDTEQIAAHANRAAPLSVSWAESKLNLVFLGRLNEIKGLELQVEVLGLLKPMGIEAVLHLIGPDDGEAGRLVEYATRLGVESDLSLVGPIYDEERFRLLRRADAVLLTSHSECNSFSAAETFAAGGLLIATDTCNLDVAESKGAAIVVSRSAKEVADAIESVVRAPTKSNEIRRNAHKFSSHFLGREKLASSMLDFYQDLLSQDK